MDITANLKNAFRYQRGEVILYYGEIEHDTKGRWSNGVPIRTSQVIHESDKQEDGSVIVKTLNSTYKVYLK